MKNVGASILEDHWIVRHLNAVPLLGALYRASAFDACVPHSLKNARSLHYDVPGGLRLAFGLNFAFGHVMIGCVRRVHRLLWSHGAATRGGFMTFFGCQNRISKGTKHFLSGGWFS